MPKPLKKAAPKPPAKPRKPKRPSDPNRAAHAMIAEHMARLDPDPAPEPTPPAAPLDFEAAYKAHMAKLGSKGGKVGGKRRLDTLTAERRREIASKAARAMWARRRRSGKGSDDTL
jgi:hypothetical protein